MVKGRGGGYSDTPSFVSCSRKEDGRGEENDILWYEACNESSMKGGGGQHEKKKERRMVMKIWITFDSFLSFLSHLFLFVKAE